MQSHDSKNTIKAKQPALSSSTRYLKTRKDKISTALQNKGPKGVGGGTLIFSSFVGSGPASTVHPKNIRNFKHP